MEGSFPISAARDLRSLAKKWFVFIPAVYAGGWDMRAKGGSLKSVHLSGSIWRRRIGRVNLGEGAGVIHAKTRGREGRAEKGAATEGTCGWGGARERGASH